MSNSTNKKITLKEVTVSTLLKKIALSGAEKGMIKAFHGEETSYYEKYLFSTQIKATNILSVFQTLELIIDLLSEYHPEHNNSNYSLESDTKFILELKYHFENFYYRIIKIKDLLLVLINHILLLNIKEKYCNYDKLIKEIEKQSLNNVPKRNSYEHLIALISNLRQSISEIENFRNKITHRESYSDNNIDVVTGLLFGREMMKNPDYSNELSLGKQIPNDKIEKYIGEVVIIKLKEFRDINSSLLEWTFHFFESLVGFFEMNMENIKD